MKGKFVFVSLSMALLVVVATIGLSKSSDQIAAPTVHEWGTFTSVAGANGEAMPWRTYNGSVDLPCFVERFPGFKSGLYGNVRMETPVVYFYGSRPSTANLKVSFPNGTITEWYPQASLNRSFDEIEWRNIRISPESSPDFPTGKRNHYFAARATDAAPLEVGTQKEKFLFYRGVGNFTVPLSVRESADGQFLIKNLGSEPIDGLVLFENRRGSIRYQVAGALKGELTLDLKSVNTDRDALFQQLVTNLVNEGLYQKEAQAMVETWRDSWFEEGTRVFYILPRRAVDAVLPLNIDPAPSQIARVFVGRMETVTAEIQADVRDAIARNDASVLAKYGRFLEPIAQRIGAKGALMDKVYTQTLSSCQQ